MKLFIILFIFISSNLLSQHILEIKYEGCDTQEFGMEGKDTTEVKISSLKFLEVFVSTLDEEDIEDIEGVLTFQIIVYMDGSSCLISARNETNLKTELLINKEVLDTELEWEKPKENTCAMIQLVFRDGNVKYSRLGSNMKRGWYILKDN